jgi:hypothetical protein
MSQSHVWWDGFFYGLSLGVLLGLGFMCVRLMILFNKDKP